MYLQLSGSPFSTLSRKLALYQLDTETGPDTACCQALKKRNVVQGSSKRTRKERVRAQCHVLICFDILKYVLMKSPNSQKYEKKHGRADMAETSSNYSWRRHDTKNNAKIAGGSSRQSNPCETFALMSSLHDNPNRFQTIGNWELTLWDSETTRRWTTTLCTSLKI